MTITQRSNPRTRLTIMLALAACGAFLALAAIIVVLQNDRNDPVTTPAPNAATARAYPTQPSTSEARSAPPTAAPAGISWSLVGQAAVPVSASDGPARISGCIASGFVRSPVGALIAAAQISTRAGYYAGRSCWEPTITDQVTASADRDALLSLLRDADSQGQPDADPGDLAPIVAFRYLSYTSDTAVVGLIRRSPQGNLAQTTLTLTWVDADWKLAAPPGGRWPALITPLTDLAGAVTWGAS